MKQWTCAGCEHCNTDVAAECARCGLLKHVSATWKPPLPERPANPTHGRVTGTNTATGASNVDGLSVVVIGEEKTAGDSDILEVPTHIVTIPIQTVAPTAPLTAPQPAPTAGQPTGGSVSSTPADAPVVPTVSPCLTINCLNSSYLLKVPLVAVYYGIREKMLMLAVSDTISFILLVVVTIEATNACSDESPCRNYLWIVMAFLVMLLVWSLLLCHLVKGEINPGPFNLLIFEAAAVAGLLQIPISIEHVTPINVCSIIWALINIPASLRGTLLFLNMLFNMCMLALIPLWIIAFLLWHQTVDTFWYLLGPFMVKRLIPPAYTLQLQAFIQRPDSWFDLEISDFDPTKHHSMASSAA